MCLPLENSVYQRWMTFQMWNKTHLENGQISRWTVRRCQECVWHRGTTTTLQRRKTLWTPPRSYYIHQVSPVKCKTDQLLSICLQSLLLIEPLLAENHFAIILSPESLARSPPPFAKEKGLSHSNGMMTEFVSFLNKKISTSQVIPLSKQRIWHAFSCKGAIYITINVMKITVHQSLVSLAENSQ